MFSIQMTGMRTTWSFLALATLLGAGTACSQSSAEGAPAANTAAANAAADLMAEGMQRLQSGDPGGAAEIFRRVLRDKPTHYGAQYQLARALDEVGKPAEARVEWEKALKAAQEQNDSLSVVRATARLALPDTLSQQQRMAKGLDLMHRQGNPAAAAAEFSQVLERQPEHYGATYQLAKALDAFGQPEEARKWWVKVVALAEAANDQVTADSARARIQRAP